MCLTEYDEEKVLQFQYKDGVEDGIEDDKRNVILALYKKGMTLEFISDIVHKTIKEIKNILLEQGISLE